jgi:phosphonate transport system substrate-binding protein
MRKLIALFVVLFGLSALADQGPLTFALRPDKNPDAMMSEKGQLEQFLRQELGRNVKVVVPISGAAIQEGFRNGTIDGAFLSGLEMIKAKRAKSATMQLAVEIDKKRSYESYWVTKIDNPVSKVEQLKGQPIAFASRTSTSGFLIPFADLIKKKSILKPSELESYFGKGNVFYGTGYVSAIERVLSGQSLAAAVSDYVLKEDKHLTYEQKSQLKIVGRQGPVPTHLFATRASLSESERNKLNQALLALNKNPSLRDQLFAGVIAKADSDQHLKNLEEALKLTEIVLD